MRNREAWWALALAAALLVAGCGDGNEAQSSTAPDPTDVDELAAAAWMDDAEVRVTEDFCGGVVTVELVNAAVGHGEVMDRESLAPDPGSCIPTT